jgi:hypothetical protein
VLRCLRCLQRAWEKMLQSTELWIWLSADKLLILIGPSSRDIGVRGYI